MLVHVHVCAQNTNKRDTFIKAQLNFAVCGQKLDSSPYSAIVRVMFTKNSAPLVDYCDPFQNQQQWFCFSHEMNIMAV